MSALRKLSTRLQLMIGRCVIRAVQAGGGRVTVNIEALEGEEAEACEYAEPTGLTSIPLPGSEGLTLSVMGERGNRVIIPMGDRRHRPQDLKPGEVSLFDDQGHRIDILRDRIRITAPDLLEIVTPEATINGDHIATITDKVDVKSGSSKGLWPIVTGVGNR